MSSGWRVNRLAAGGAWLILAYQRVISPILPRACRFEPSCSKYARQALLQHGVVRGSWLAIRRLLRCHPFHPGGYDPLPPARTWKNERSWRRF